MTSSSPTRLELHERLDSVMLRDQRRLRRRVREATTKGGAALDRLVRDIGEAETKVARRAAIRPVAPKYPKDLPVSERKDEILAAIRDSQVVIVAGETGSGKSTQLPKICLELGRGVRGLIGHTQPRRIAARTLAERVAEELDTSVGEIVGYTVRFTDQVSDDTLVRLMTDGILLAEIQRDRDLTRYDTLIIDEAHERSLNIDFILGYLKQLLPRRPDLKVIVTSATIDTQRFSEHFDAAPIVEVTGRTYPVEVRYRPLTIEGDDDADDVDRDQVQAIVDAVDELQDEGNGDVLVFLSGEREIRDTADALHAADFAHTEILPLYARLSSAEQHRVFEPHAGRRVVLATNVAETSLTVPGIRYVVDAGTARVSRYNRRTKVQRLPIEPISQAAANQRAGRCGRVAPGICIRLYSEDDFESRPAFTEPEILRTNLASVILQMAAIGLGDIAAFPFVEPPEARNIKDGIVLLEELGALDAARDSDSDVDHRLTPLGRKLAQLPLDPRLARMVIEAGKHGCVREVMVIAAALSIQDPRERPQEKQQAADEMHRRFADKDSDFITLVRLWDYLREQQRELSSNQFRKLCRREYLNYLRVREWQDIYSQLRQMTKQLGVHLNTEPADADSIHLSLLSGLISQIGMKDGERPEYLGARNARFMISPGSALFRKPPKWVMAAELVETTRLWARIVARIDPDWVEKVAGHLVKRSYTEPEWDAERGAAMANERVTLYGLPIVTSRRVNYGRIDPPVAREMFVRHALVEGDWKTPHRFWRENERRIEEIRRLEDRVRRHDLLVGQDELFDFYDARVGPDVVSARSFDGWWKRERQKRPDLLDFAMETLLHSSVRGIRLDDFPDTCRQGDLELPMSYVFDPTSDDDGAAVHIPVAVLNRVRADGFDWHIPGLRLELVTSLLRALPKDVRRHFVPAPDSARDFLTSYGPSSGPLLPTLAHYVTSHSGERWRAADWHLDVLPPHLRMLFIVEDDQRRTLASGRDLEALKERLQGRVREAIAKAAGSTEQSGATSWTFGTIEREVESRRGGHTVKAYPALVDEGSSVGLRLFETPGEQQRAMWSGTRRLLLLTVASPVPNLDRRLSNAAKLALAHGPYPTVRQLLDECVETALDELVVARGGPAWDEDGWRDLHAYVKAQLPDAALAVARLAADVLAAVRDIDVRVASITSPALAAAQDDIRSQVARFVFPGFVAVIGSDRLRDVRRYLDAIAHRLDKIPGDVARDADRMRRIQRLEDDYERVLATLPASRRFSTAAQDVRWMIEELRVSVFAQHMRTPIKVSEERVRRELQSLVG
ncbi:MAG TPA: ATP-dependent RNA helicase HrpA [Acidimicrobiales bacterium]|jgi:ATP-dependent helicase HrpA|nr:ATP-dependent RNA helicase HrpA [Acidimicrobiales bacterium]